SGLADPDLVGGLVHSWQDGGDGRVIERLAVTQSVVRVGQCIHDGEEQLEGGRIERAFAIAHTCEDALERVTRLFDGRHVRHTRSTLHRVRDRKSTRLNSSHVKISYAVFCL